MKMASYKHKTGRLWGPAPYAERAESLVRQIEAEIGDLADRPGVRRLLEGVRALGGSVDTEIEDLRADLSTAQTRAAEAEDKLAEAVDEAADLRVEARRPIETLRAEALAAATTDPRDPAWDLYFHLDALAEGAA